MRLEFLKKKLARLNEKKSKLDARFAASADAAEIRSLTDQLSDLRDEIEETRAEIAMLEAEKAKAEAEEKEKRDTVPANAQLVNPITLGQAPAEKRGENPLASMEYRQAFRDYVVNGTPIPAEFRNGEAITTAETGAAIPFEVMNRVTNTVRKRYGNLYNKVTKTSVKGGVEVPVGALQATFKWISESTVSPRQKVAKLSKVIFQYHTAEIRIAQSFLAQLLTLESFEARLVEVLVVAYLQAMDYGIINGSGDGCMLGVLNDPRVTNTVTMTAADMKDWTKWRKKFFASLPLGYRAGEFVFPISTVDSYLSTMADANNNPIFRQATGLEVNDGDATNPGGRFFGREVSLVEPDIIADFDSASAGDVIGLFWQPEEYYINENFGFTMRRYFDEETNEWVDKALVVVDGKVVNPTGYYKIIKG